MKPEFTPRTIGPTADGSRLEIVWEDDHRSEYAPFDLRLMCPCAGCVDEMTGQRTAAPLD